MIATPTKHKTHISFLSLFVYFSICLFIFRCLLSSFFTYRSLFISLCERVNSVRALPLFIFLHHLSEVLEFHLSKLVIKHSVHEMTKMFLSFAESSIEKKRNFYSYRFEEERKCRKEFHWIRFYPSFTVFLSVFHLFCDSIARFLMHSMLLIRVRIFQVTVFLLNLYICEHLRKKKWN